MKKMIDVICLMSQGKVFPKNIVWENGQLYKIDKVIDVKKMASTKAGGFGVRYEVMINNQTRYLFLDEYTWFVES